MNDYEILSFLREKRGVFLQKLCECKKKNQLNSLQGYFEEYLKRMYECYLCFIDNMIEESFEATNFTFNLDSISDFLKSIKEQISNCIVSDVNDIVRRIHCVEFNMVINIHSIAFEILYFLDSSINVKKYYFGESLEELIAKQYDFDDTIETFLKNSPYDTETICYLDIFYEPDFYVIKNALMEDIYYLDQITSANETELGLVIDEIIEMNRKNDWMDSGILCYAKLVQETLFMFKKEIVN